MYNDDEARKSDEEYMRSLYDRFRKEVESGAVIDYYEINELLDIYDYAQDEGDAMVQMFVFLTASRLYPDNHEFDERMAFFLSYVSQDAASDMAMRGGRRDTPLWDVLQMGVKNYPSGDPEGDLDRILTKYDKLDCESVLKIIDLLRELDRRDLLVKYYPRLSKRAEDSRGLAFEVAETLKEDDAYLEEARRVAEELTRLEPFNIEAWLLLARIEFGLSHTDDALAAVDYALAIDPDHFNARLTKGVIMVVMDDKRSESIEILEEILSKDPLNNYALEGLAEAYIRDKRIKEACDIYAVMLCNGINTAGNIDPMSVIAELAPENLDDYLEMAYHRLKVPAANWRTLIMGLMEKDKLKLAGRVADYYYTRAGADEGREFYLHILYDSGMHERYVEVFEELSGGKIDLSLAPPYLTATDYILLACIYLRLGRRDDAVRVCKQIETDKHSGDSIDDFFKQRGIKLTARLIRAIAASDELPENLKNFDPLAIDFSQ